MFAGIGREQCGRDEIIADRITERPKCKLVVLVCLLGGDPLPSPFLPVAPSAAVRRKFASIPRHFCQWSSVQRNSPSGRAVGQRNRFSAKMAT